MEDITRRGEHDLNLASRKAQEAGWRRFQATEWLESFVGPLGISKEPSEREFISCLRNGLILCNAINKIQPGSVPKVVENSHFTSQSVTWDSQPLPAYQFFENVRNFLKAVDELKLPVFEASVFDMDNLEAGSSTKIVDCVLAIKAYHEWKQMTGGNGSFKPQRSPLVTHSAGRIPSGANCRWLDMSANWDKQPHAQSETQKFEDSIVRALVECMVDTKENIDENLISSLRNGNLDPIKFFGRIFSSSLEQKHQYKFPELKAIIKDLLREGKSSLSNSGSTSPEYSSVNQNRKCLQACLNKGNSNHWQMFQIREKELSSLKVLLSRTKEEFGDLQLHLQSDLTQLENQMGELSTAALGYHKVLKENRTLYNMVQDLKGNIRVYCRIRPAFSAEAKNVIDFIGEDGSLVVLDPSKPHKDGKKLFQFNRVFGPTSTQDEVFKDTQSLIRSVMDGYNVCIFAYGQTGSGKTHTMCGPSGGSTKEMGINYLALNDLFQLSNRRKDIMKYNLHVQMVEIYNEQVRDLLSQDSATSKLEIQSCTGDNGLSLPDATMHSVKSTADVLNLMKLGEVNRVVSSTAINHQSSRSHSILTFHVHSKDVNGSTLRSCLHLVDLAGSERVDKSEVTGEGLKEAQHINKSLSCLGDVITALAQKNSYIPYRNSKLTLLLQNSLGGNAKTLMFAHVSPEGDSFGETVSTLKFAQWASTVELGAARLNKESREVMDLKEQIESLKRQLANKEVQSAHKPEEPKLLFQKPKATIERTPPCSRRLSIENGSAQTEKATNFGDKKGNKSPSVQPRSRRLSLEGPKYANRDSVQIKISETVYSEKSVQPPRSQTTSALKSRVVKTDGRTKIPSLIIPKTPEPVRNEVQISSENRTHGLISTANGKGSHIRKSLRTIGKLINGYEKRNPQKVTGTIPSPILPSASRRQSLSGIQPSDKYVAFAGTDESRNAKTPPPVHPSTKLNQWM